MDNLLLAEHFLGGAGPVTLPGEGLYVGPALGPTVAGLIDPGSVLTAAKDTTGWRGPATGWSGLTRML